jgi:hypothetical protein
MARVKNRDRKDPSIFTVKVEFGIRFAHRTDLSSSAKR